MEGDRKDCTSSNRRGASQTARQAVIPDLDIYRSANVLIKQHGQDAPIHAAIKADAMLEAGDLDGVAVWRRVLRAVEELQGTDPKPGEAVH